MWRRWATLAVAAFLVGSATAMRLDPERIRARIRIEEEIEEERLAKVGRNRRQLATPKEISISVTAPLFSSRPFEFGPGSGDTEIPQSLDVGKKLSLKYPLVFYGKEYSNLYILSNGGIGFDATARSYRPNVLPGPTKLIAPFWNRNDLRNGGHVYYREVTSGRVLERGASEIRYQYDKQVKIKSAIVVTWEKMQPLGSAPLPDENTNTFQVALFVTENGTFANMIYNNIGWTQGAEAGFNPGEESLEYYSLPTSGTGNIMYLEENGNTGIPGEWMFELEEDRVTRCKAGFKGDTCDAECKKGEWGPDCVRCCRCSNDACHTATGECTQGGCRDCWGGQACQIKEETCSITQTVTCAHNAVSYADADRCGEPQQRCQCLNGFVGDGLKKCEDIDECAASPSPCHADAICTNTPGRFFCECRPGFTGDGVSDCHTDFLYPHAGNDALPTSKNSKVSYQLKTPMKIFGAMHEKVTVSTNGLIALGEPESAQLAGFRRLEEMPGVHGIAPFHAPIDVSQGGQVTVSEVTDPLVLQRATDTVRENYGDPTFKATNALIVTYMNVTNGKNAHGNTFQSLLIGGRDGHGQRLSFVEMLYQDLGWSDGAEAEIMADDVANSVALPGSGTEGVEQLSQLSNIHQPGVWLYRIDNKDVQPCVRSGLQPPYCDSAAPTLISESEPPTQPTSRGSALPEKNAIVPAETPPIGVTFGGPRAIQPEIAGEPAAAPSSRPRSTTSRPRPVFQSTPHRPIVSLDAGDIENMPPDVFEATFPPFITVVPELISSKKSQGLFAQPSTSAARPLPDFTKGTITPPSTVVHQKPASVEDDDGEVIEVNPIQQIIPELPRTAPTGAAVTSQNIQPLRTTGVATPVPRTTTEEPEEEEELSEGPITEGSKEPIFVFTTSKPILTTIRQFAVTKPRIVTASTSPADGPIRGPFEEQESEAASSKLAIIIPTAIVLVWLVVIGIVAIIACCRKKRSQRNFHSMYGGPVYPRSMAGAYALRRNSKGFEGSYEDHLEKAARLSSEMNAYNNQSSRVSLYGSYWNLAAANSSSPGSSGSPHRTSPFAPTYTSSNQRYSYTTGRY